MKLGVVFAVAVQPTLDPQTGEIRTLAQAMHNSYVAHLGGPDILGELTWAEARRRGWEQAQETVAPGDGAPWIWNQVALHFAQSHQVVDGYHAKAHLTAAARLMKTDGTPAFTRWLNRRETLLYQGQAEKIALDLERAARKQEGAPAEALVKAASTWRRK